MKQKGRVAVLLSGRGSNFEALYQASLRPGSNYEIVIVISNKKSAPGLDKARAAGIEAVHVSPRKYSSKGDYEGRVVELLEQRDIQLVCLAGYMRIVGNRLLDAFPNRIMNIHPALLPAFPGLHAQKQAINYGVRVSGCTVHFVDSGMDTGPIILQRVVEVKAGDTEDTLGARILAQEHQVFAEAVKLFFDNKLKIVDRNVIIVQ
jgi:phosphoribosylglycinamide formyltransferase-1